MRVAIFAALSFSTLVVASPTPQSQTTVDSDALSQACADIKARQAETVGRLFIPISQAVACVSSIPLNKTITIDTLAGLKKYYQFQSTLSWLKNPPEDVKSNYDGGVDVLGGLDAIADDVRSEKTTTQWEVDQKVSQLVNQVHDGHTTYSSGLLSSFGVNRNISVVSIADDVASQAKIYLWELKEPDPGTDAITHINDEPVVPFLSKLARTGDAPSSQSPDAQFNCMIAGNDIGGKRLSEATISDRFRVPETLLEVYEKLEMKFESGLTRSFEFKATWTIDMSDIKTTSDFYEEVVRKGRGMDSTAILPNDVQPVARALKESDNGNQTMNGIPATANDTTTTTESDTLTAGNRTSTSASLPDTATLIAVDKANTFIALFLNDNTTAVLNANSFDGTGGDSGIEKSLAYMADVVDNVLEKFFDRCVSEEKKNLIIDLRMNGGGDVLLGSLLYLYLFPEAGTPLEVNTRARSVEAARLMATAGANLTGTDDTVLTVSPWFKSQILDQNNKPFATVEDFMGPFVVNGDNMTAIIRTDVENSLGPGGKEGLAGIAKRKQPFEAKNIVLITDAICASTCSVFAELLATKQRIRTIGVGGVPGDAPMSSIGGTRGFQTLSFNNLKPMANETRARLEPSPEMDQLPGDMPMAVSGAVNILDNLRKPDDTIPLQFVDDWVDCRLSWTWETWRKPALLWDYVAKSAFGDQPMRCAPGSRASQESVNTRDCNAPTRL